MGCSGSKSAVETPAKAAEVEEKKAAEPSSSAVADFGGAGPAAPAVVVPTSPHKPQLTAKALKAARSSAAVQKLFASVGSPADQPSWAAELTDKDAAAWLEAIQAAVDALWEPLLSRAEERLAAPRAVPAYDSLKPASLLVLLRDVAGLSDDGKRWAGATATTALLRAAAALWERAQAAGKAVPAEAEAKFVNASLRRLLSLLSLALCRTVAVEDAAAFEAKVGTWHALLDDFGLCRPQLCALLDAAAKGLLLYVEAATRGDAQLRIQCERATALQQALPQWEASKLGAAAARPGGPASAKLFPRFHDAAKGGWEAGEGHGPRKEFFALVGQQLLHGCAPALAASEAKAEAQAAAAAAVAAAAAAPAAAAGGAGPSLPPLLPYQPEPRQHWFDVRARPSAEAKRLLRFAGWLMAQTLFNRSTLQVRVPVLLFRRLVDGADFAASLALLEEFDPAAAAGVGKVARLSDADFAMTLELEDAAAGTTREQYAEAAARRVLREQAAWQLDALAAGFHAALPRAALRGVLFSPRQLADAVCGGGGDDGRADFSLRQTFRVVEDDELRECAPLRDALWATLEALPPARKRALVRFVTGSARLPAPGCELFWVQMPFVAFSPEELVAEGRKLPQAHTCDNILELPNYYAALRARRGLPEGGRPDAALLKAARQELRQTLAARFELAVTECDAYGLDEGGGGAHGAGPGWHAGALGGAGDEGARELSRDGGRHGGGSDGAEGVRAEARAEEARAAADEASAVCAVLEAIPSLDDADLDALLDDVGAAPPPGAPDKAWRLSGLDDDSARASRAADGAAAAGGAAGGAAAVALVAAGGAAGGAPSDGGTPRAPRAVQPPPMRVSAGVSDVDALLAELDGELEAIELGDTVRESARDTLAELDDAIEAVELPA